MIEVPTSQLQTDAISEAAALRGMSPGDYTRDCALTQAATHLQRSLTQWLDIEDDSTGAGARCGARLTVREATPVADKQEMVCERPRGHQNDAVAAGDVHAQRDVENDWVTWQG